MMMLLYIFLLHFLKQLIYLSNLFGYMCNINSKLKRKEGGGGGKTQYVKMHVAHLSYSNTIVLC